jgi:hypothetical protein
MKILYDKGRMKKLSEELGIATDSLIYGRRIGPLGPYLDLAHSAAMLKHFFSQKNVLQSCTALIKLQGVSKQKHLFVTFRLMTTSIYVHDYK